MGKQQKEDLPTLEDFTEDSLLDSLVDDDDDDKKTGTDGAGDDDDDDPDKDKDEDGSGDDEDKDDDNSDADDKDDDSDDDSDDDQDEDEDEDEDDKDKDDDDGDDTGETFWTDVEKLTGRAVEVDYGDVDPESPEGAALREEALVQQAINDHLDYLAKVYPREFKALEHAANGGRIEDLYNPAEPDYTKIEIPKDDEDFQRNFLKSYYEKKGFSPAKAARMVEVDEDSDAEDGLYKAAKEALNELAIKQEAERNKVLEQQKLQAEQQKKQDMEMVSTVEKIVQSGKLNKFTVPVKEREKFYQFALQHIQRNPQGGYMIVQPVDPRQLEVQLQEMYFAFKGGDLSTIIQREVKTESAKRLKRNVSKAARKKSSADDDDRHKDKRTLPTLEDFTA